MNDTTLGQRIAEQRKKLGISQEALGEKVGVSRQAISKWESDGAVPEIDKLIGLSRLFSVSVGWLLGVEETTPPKPDELTEAQLKMVEEIVRRYQPQPEKRKFPWGPILAVLAAAALLIAVFPRQSAPDYSGQISSLQSNFQSVQSELRALSGQVQDMAAAAEDAEKLLQSYEFSLVRLDRLRNTATIVFRAHPKQWTDGSTGCLSVSRAGEQVFFEVCDWNGADCTVQAELPIEDGYEYCFLIDRGDGSQQIQVLDEYQWSDLAYGTDLHCTIDSFLWSYDSLTWDFYVRDLWVCVEKPALGSADDALWTEAGTILYRNGEVLERHISPIEDNAGDETLMLGYMNTSDLAGSHKPVNGDTLELTYYAALDNGMSLETTIARWTFRNGTLVLDSD